MKNIKMLYYDRIDISEAIDVNKTSESKEWDTRVMDAIIY